MFLCSLNQKLRQVNSGHVKSLLRKCDGMTTGAAAQVEHGSLTNPGQPNQAFYMLKELLGMRPRGTSRRILLARMTHQQTTPDPSFLLRHSRLIFVTSLVETRIYKLAHPPRIICRQNCDRKTAQLD